ncbi:S8 family serine peptidase [Christensenellaceae bacterium OttesenSCG-928-M15]|nr:S8 family serine peptidase [Christensenellaceae bacterium OttesenSCG-928-M15]
MSKLIRPENGAEYIETENARIFVSYGQPTHYSPSQEIFFEFVGTDGGPIPSGIWSLVVTGEQVVTGNIDLWLPTLERVAASTAFLEPSPETTLTLPSTSLSVITVGGYHALTDSIAPFSGRGYTRNSVYVKPDIVAPAVDIYSTRPGGGYGLFSGTSFATPFVTGAAALIMEWGIVKGNDPYLYGQKVKAYLRKNAGRHAHVEYPNPLWGYGSLCLRAVLDDLIDDKQIEVEENGDD